MRINEMNSKNEEKNLLQQITYLSRLIGQKSDATAAAAAAAATNKYIFSKNKNTYHTSLKTCSGIRNKYKLKLNHPKNQPKSSTQSLCSTSSLLQNKDSNTTYSKLKTLHKKINVHSTSNPDKNTPEIQVKHVDTKLVDSLPIGIKKSIYINHKKIFKNSKSSDYEQSSSSSSNNIHLNPHKLVMRSNKNKIGFDNYSSNISNTNSSDTVTTRFSALNKNCKIPTKNSIHVNPKFRKDCVAERVIPSLNHIDTTTKTSVVLNTQDINEDNEKNCKHFENDILKIHFNKKFINCSSALKCINSTSDPSKVLNQTVVPQLVDKVNSLESNKFKKTSDNVTNNNNITTSSGNISKIFKLRKTIKDQKNKYSTIKQGQNISFLKTSAQKNVQPPHLKYKYINQKDNMLNLAAAASRKMAINRLNTANNKPFLSKKLINSTNKNLKLTIKEKQADRQKLQPVMKRISNTKLPKLVKLSKTKLIREKLDSSSTNHSCSFKISSSSGKTYQNTTGNKKNKSVWLAPGNNLQCGIQLKKVKTVPLHNKESTSPYKFNRVKNNISNKFSYIRTHPKVSGKKVPSASIKNVKNQNTITSFNPKGKYYIQKHKMLFDRLSFNPNFISVSRTKLIRNSNNDTPLVCSCVKNLQKYNGNQTTVNDRAIKAQTLNKTALTLRLARSVKSKYKYIRNSNLNRLKMEQNLLLRRNQKANITNNMKAKFVKGLIRNSPRHRKKSITIGGINYHTTKMKLRRKFPAKEGKVDTNKIVKNKGASFCISNTGRSLKRIASAANAVRYGYNNVLQRSNTHFAHSKVIQAKQRSIALLTKKLRKCNEPCLIFNRFGQCSSKERGTCNRLHDRKRVAICRKFLQGTCEKNDCLLSHDVGPSKMPTCRHYLAGICVRDNCPYLHVKLSSSAPICVQFLQGYCPDAEKCKRRHIEMCPELEDRGVCSKGKSCPYPHPKFKTLQKKIDRDINFSESKEKSNIDVGNKSDIEGTCEEIIEDKDMEIIANRYYFASENNIQNDQIDHSSVKRKFDNIHDDSAGSNWLRKRPRIGDLPSFIPLNTAHFT
ncbi:zinc finger CCCH domain-containing protein 3 [Lycorma delicatula]|uniref:zinc finger CCCH domain-containing protein 3 n=1 Tax=Lycorma delicatula TaxID=130591 RepID=UPI003F511C08